MAGGTASMPEAESPGDAKPNPIPNAVNHRQLLFDWRVYKVKSFEGADGLSRVLVGRTTYAMSGEVPRSMRVSRTALAPADVVFFGSRGPKSKPSEVGHMGIYVGNGWFVHSSSGGVTLQPLEGWYATTLAWARRPLAEAGLAV